MTSKKITRYYSECGRGFWKKDRCKSHELNCKCWKNPKFKTCLSCALKNFVRDSNGMEHEPQFHQTWIENMCQHSESGIPAHETCEHIRKHCQNYIQKGVKP